MRRAKPSEACSVAGFSLAINTLACGSVLARQASLRDTVSYCGLACLSKLRICAQLRCAVSSIEQLSSPDAKTSAQAVIQKPAAYKFWREWEECCPEARRAFRFPWDRQLRRRRGRLQADLPKARKRSRSLRLAHAPALGWRSLHDEGEWYGRSVAANDATARAPPSIKEGCRSQL